MTHRCCDGHWNPPWNPRGAPISLGAGNLTPRYGLATTRTVDDSGGATPSITSITSYADAATGIDPALGLATGGTIDPGGLALTSRIGYEPYGVGSLLRPVTTRAPSGPASQVTTAYYAAKTDATAAETRTNPCPGGTSSSQHGLAKRPSPPRRPPAPRSRPKWCTTWGDGWLPPGTATVTSTRPRGHARRSTRGAGR